MAFVMVALNTGATRRILTGANTTARTVVVAALELKDWA